MSKYNCSASALVARLQGDEKFYRSAFDSDESEDELYDQFEEEIMESDLSHPRDRSSSSVSTTSSEFDESFDENECSICFLEVEMNTLECGHKFCKECLGQYLTLMIRRDEPQSLSHTVSRVKLGSISLINDFEQVYKIEPSDGHLSVNRYDFYGVSK